MGLTSPDNIFYPDNSYTDGFVDAMTATADSVQAAFDGLGASDLQTYRWADAAARAAESGMLVGDKGYQTDTGVLYRYSGSLWSAWESDWITWSTAPTNLTVGTGGSAASVQRYKWVTGRLLFDVKYVLGSSGASMGSNPTLNLPVNVSFISPYGNLMVGDVQMADVSVPAAAFGKFSIGSASTVIMRTYVSAASGAISSTVPWTWAAGDIIGGNFWADPA